MEIAFNTDAREQLIRGINKLGDAVGSTMGPHGTTVIIPDKDEYGKYKVTKDGVSVANSIKFYNPIENIGAQLIKQAAQKQLDDAGDGTTTTTILSQAFVNNLKDFKTSDVNKVFDDIIPQVIDQLKLNSRKLNYEDIRYVASISANNDIQIGDIIQQAYNFSNIIKVEESALTEDSVNCVDGMLLEVSYFHKDFVTNPKKGTCEFDECGVVLIDGKLEKLDCLKAILEHYSNTNTPLLIVTEHAHEQVLFKLRTFVVNQQLQVCVIKTPGFGPHRKDLLNDIARFTGATPIADMTKTYSTQTLGTLKSISIGKNSSVLTRCEDIDVTELIASLKEQLSSADLTSYDKDLIQQRIDYLTGKVSIIKVGGKTENEMKERLDRYDDAVKAVACALEEGIVKGGGVALYDSVSPIAFRFGNMADTTIEFGVFKSIIEPVTKLGTPVSNDLFGLNIIDPLKVTRCALENAVSVAKIILSTNAVVLNENEWRTNLDTINSTVTKLL